MLEHEVGVVLAFSIVEIQAGFEFQHHRPVRSDSGRQGCILHPVGFCFAGGGVRVADQLGHDAGNEHAG